MSRKKKNIIEAVVDLINAFAVAVIITTSTFCLTTWGYFIDSLDAFVDMRFAYLFVAAGALIIAQRSTIICINAKGKVKPATSFGEPDDVLGVFGVASAAIVAYIMITALYQHSFFKATYYNARIAEHIDAYFWGIVIITGVVLLLFMAIRSLAMKYYLDIRDAEIEKWVTESGFGEDDLPTEDLAEAENVNK